MVIISDNGKIIPVEYSMTEKIHEGDCYYATKVREHIELLFLNRIIMHDIDPLGETPTLQLISKYVPGRVDEKCNIHLPQDLIKYAHLENGAVIVGNSDRAIISRKPV